MKKEKYTDVFVIATRKLRMEVIEFATTPDYVHVIKYFLRYIVISGMCD